MTCTPQRLRSGDVLHIDLPLAHGDELAVFGPNDGFALLAENDQNGGVGENTLNLKSPLGETHSLEIKVSSLSGEVSGLSGPVLLKKMFEKPGIYLFEVSPELEMEDPTIDGSCKVLFTPGPRRTVGGAARLRPALKP